MGECGCQQSAEGELVGWPGPEIHGGRGVEVDLPAVVGVVLELFDVERVTPSPDLPVEVAEIVALNVLAVTRELRRVAEERTAVKSIEKTFHDGPGQERQVFHRRQQARVDGEVCGHGFNKSGKGHELPDRNVLQKAVD